MYLLIHIMDLIKHLGVLIPCCKQLIKPIFFPTIFDFYYCKNLIVFKYIWASRLKFYIFFKKSKIHFPFENLIEKERFKKQIFTMQQTSLFWIRLPCNPEYVGKKYQLHTSRQTISRIIFEVYGIDTDSHSLSLLLIRKYKDPWCFNIFKKLPIMYLKENGWIQAIS